MARHAVSAVFVGAALSFGIVLCGAGAPKGKEPVDVRKLRVLKLPDKDMPVTFALPAAKKSAKGPEPIKWGFVPLEEKKKSTFAFLEEAREKFKKVIEDADSGEGEKKVQLSPGDRAFIEHQLQVIAAASGRMEKFFGEARLAVEDTADKTTGVVMTAVEINRDYKLDRGVAEAKGSVPPWRNGRAKGEPQIIYDKADKRFKSWEGWKIIQQWTGVAKENETPPIYYDAIHVYRRVLKSGKVFMVELHAHWDKTKDKDQAFDKQIDALLAGLTF